MQRIILSFLCLFSLHGNYFQGLISFAIVDTFTGDVQKVLLEEGEIQVDNQFIVKVSSIKSDTENPEIAWIDMTINHKALENDMDASQDRKLPKKSDKSKDQDLE